MASRNDDAVRHVGKKRPLLRAGSAPPPSATTSMLEAMLDGKKAKKNKKRRKQLPSSSTSTSTTTLEEPHRRGTSRRLPSVLDSTHNPRSLPDRAVLSSGGLMDAPSVFREKTVASSRTSNNNSTLHKSVDKVLVDKENRKLSVEVDHNSSNAACIQRVENSGATAATRGLSLGLSLQIRGGNTKRTRERMMMPTSNRSLSVSTSFERSVTTSISIPLKSDTGDTSIVHVAPCPISDAERKGESTARNPSESTTATTSIQNPPVRNSQRNTLSSTHALQPTRLLEKRNGIVDDSIGVPSRKNKQEATTGKRTTTKVNNDNFVRLNLRNSAGACRGARRSKSSRRHKESNARTQGEVDAGSGRFGFAKKANNSRRRTAQSGVDPLDDFVDGVFQASDKQSKSKDNSDEASKCARHQRPCKLLKVKKNTGNKGRHFYVCSQPRGEQCDHFEWADDTAEAAQRALLKNSNHSGFVARQVAAYTERFKTLTVPELKEEAKHRKLSYHGKRKQLLTRLSLWVRDELAQVTGDKYDEEQLIVDEHRSCEASDDSCSDDSSVSSYEELELMHPDRDENDRPFSPTCEGTGDISNENTTTLKKEEALAEDGPVSIDKQLKDIFGHSGFREGQDWAVRRCLNFQRTLIVAPTGFGKSLCYALTASLMDGVCIVVSPLISLMQDQHRQLPPRIPAATLSGSMSAASIVSTIDDILRGRIKILFVSPERLASPSFRRLFRLRWNPETKTRERQFPAISLLCVDEAHCMSQWGHNFRPAYLRLRSLVDQLEPRSVLAMTATAGPRVAADICRALRIPINQIDKGDSEPAAEIGLKILKSDRDNIDVTCTVLETEEQRLVTLLKLLKKTKDKPSKPSVAKDSLCEGCLSSGSTIVYVWRKRDAEVVAENLVSHGIEGGIVVYHGGMDAIARSKAQSKFMRGKARICVATVAFGLGINKADVSAVVHLYLPASPENYLQEIGRAGRDGCDARAVALILRDEVVIRHSLTHSDLLSTSQIRKVLQIIRELVLGSDETNPTEGILTERVTPLSIALRLDATVHGVDCKAETVETLLSLIEDMHPEQPLLRMEGTLMDVATITLKRRSLEKVALIEEVADCILKCASRVDSLNGPATSTMAAEEDPHMVQKAFLAYSFGTYQFSIARCAALLGPHAEPRHVFAALRRMQNSGELELLLDPQSKALHMLMEPRGLNFFCGPVSDLDELADSMATQITKNVEASSNKALRANDILGQVAEVESHVESDDGEKANTKSSALRLFQDLVSEYFQGDETSADTMRMSVALPLCVQEGSLRDIAVDVSQLLRDLPPSPEFRPRESCPSWFLPLQQSCCGDYTALAIAKFLHGLDTPRVPYASFFRHPLFGKWRNFRFVSLLKCIDDLLAKNS